MATPKWQKKTTWHSGGKDRMNLRLAGKLL
jgi:hypothetical protein